MRTTFRLLAALIASSVAAQPAFSTVRAVQVQPSGPAVGSAGAAAAGAQAVGPQNVTLPSLSLGASALPAGHNISLITPSGNPAAIPTPGAVATSLAPAAAPVIGAPRTRAAFLALPAPAVPSGAKAKAAAPAAKTASPAALTGRKTADTQAGSRKSDFKKKLAAIDAAIESAGRDADTESSEGLKASADTQFDGAATAQEGDFAAALAAWEAGEVTPANQGLKASELLDQETPHFTGRQLRRVANTSKALETAVASAIEKTEPAAEFKVQSRGSSARLTHAQDDPDYDIMVRVPDGWSAFRLRTFMRDKLPELKGALEEAVLREIKHLYPGVKVKLSMGSYIQLSDPVTRRPDEGVYMLPVKVRGPSNELLIDMDLTFTNRSKYTNEYPEYFADQLAETAKLGGQAAVDGTLISIRLAKRLFKEVVGAYKVWRGGPSGVGVEQMIMQSGEVEAGDKGRTVVETGDFDKFMDRIFEIAFDKGGQLRRVKQARKLWTVFNPFREPENFLSHLSEKAWQRLANAARNYRMAKSMGRPITFEDLRRRAPKPKIARKVEKSEDALPVRNVRSITLNFDSSQKQPKMRKTVKNAIAHLRENGLSVVDFQLRWRRANGRSGYTLSMLAETKLPAEGFAEKVQALLASASGDFKSAEASKRKAGEAGLYLFIKPFGKPSHPRTIGMTQKVVRRLSRRLGGHARVRLNEHPGPNGEFVARVSPEKGVEAKDVAQMALAFFQKPGTGLRLTGVAFKETPKAAQKAEEADAPGKLTLEMLEKFTLTGPKPAERGDAFLHAQGAKVLPEGLEASWRGRRTPNTSWPDKVQIERTLLRRRGGATFILLPVMRPNGETAYRPAKVDPELAQGIVTNTLVEAEVAGRRVVSISQVGSYSMDVMIGRVVSRKGRLVLEALFREEGQVKALYERLPIKDAEGLKEGDLVQAFVKPEYAGFTAVPLENLGRKLTPEIAAREIALRHGARAYFEESVIRQAEEVGRTLDAAAEYAEIAQRMAKEAPDRKIEDMSGKPFVTIDPVGAGDLDDAFYIERHPDGGYTWYLATADVAQYVPPGTPAFRTAARIGNTFYSIDKDGVPEYPMNHPVVSKYASSLLDGKDSLAMITRMRFDKDGQFLEDDSEVFLGKVRVQGRYTYEQVVELWKGKKDHGITHLDQVSMARDLAGTLDERDGERGKLALSFQKIAHSPKADGSWGTEAVKEDPLETESHKLIEELKVYGNRGIAQILEEISTKYGIPHISRVHPPQDEATNKRLRKELNRLGVDWPKSESLFDYLRRLQTRTDLEPETKEVAQILALMTRRTAEYQVQDAEGHEGLALEAGQYDHPSTPIRRFADMYNRALLEAYLAGQDPREVYAAVVQDLTDMGFRGLEEYMLHLNGREAASKMMDREVDTFMSVYELAKPEHKGKTYKAYVKMAKEGRNAMAVIQLTDIPVSFVIRGEDANNYKLLDELAVTVHGADPANLRVDADIKKTGKIGRPTQAPQHSKKHSRRRARRGSRSR